MVSALSRNGNGLIGFLGLRECKHATFDAPASEHLKVVRKPHALKVLPPIRKEQVSLRKQTWWVRRNKGQKVDEKDGSAKKHLHRPMFFLKRFKILRRKRRRVLQRRIESTMFPWWRLVDVEEEDGSAKKH